MRLFVAFLFVAFAALYPGGAEDRRDLIASAGAPCLQQLPPPTAPADAAIHGDIGASTSHLRWTPLLSFPGVPAPHLASSTLVRDRSAAAPSSPQFRRFPLLI